MFNVVLYSDASGYSEIETHIEKLRLERANNKDSRIHYNQIVLYVSLLENNGFMLTSNFSKHLTSELWELRPGNYRILYSYVDSFGFVLLTIFRKKTQKTPRAEIDKAIERLKDFKSRMEKKILQRQMILKKWKQWLF